MIRHGINEFMEPRDILPLTEKIKELSAIDLKIAKP